MPVYTLVGVFEQHFKLETAIEGYEEDRNTCLYPRKKLIESRFTL